jgi:hypothetical protein
LAAKLLYTKYNPAPATIAINTITDQSGNLRLDEILLFAVLGLAFTFLLFAFSDYRGLAGRFWGLAVQK